MTTKISPNSIGQSLLEQLERKLNYLKVVKEWTGCWELKLAKKTNGRQYVSVGGSKALLSYRISAAIYHGLELFGDKRLVLHKNECNNEACWRPDHIYLGTYGDNTRDSIELGTHRVFGDKHSLKTHCPQGHEYSKENTYIKLNGARCCRRCKNLAQNARRKQNDKKRTGQ